MERENQLANWIAQTQWADWARHPMTGDASARRYERLTSGPASVILMDAPPSVCGSQALFVTIADHLRGCGLAAPEVLEWDDDIGLMVLQDLGHTDFATHLRSNPHDEPLLYSKAIDVISALKSSPLPHNLNRMTPNVGADMIDLAFKWAATDPSEDLAVQIKDVLRQLLQEIDPEPSCLSLRDFHAENLIWRPDETGMLQVGLLDFQDAFITHPAYDLASLLRDARRDVDSVLLDPMIEKLAPQKSRAAYRDAFHVLAIQRNLRILGIFQRLAAQDGKASYLSLIPRVWHHLETDLRAPIARQIAPLVRRAFTAPKDIA